MVTREELNARATAYNEYQRRSEQERQKALDVGRDYFKNGGESHYLPTDEYDDLHRRVNRDKIRRGKPTSLSAEELDLLMRSDSGAKYSAQGLQNALNLENREDWSAGKYVGNKFFEGVGKGVSNAETFARVALADKIEEVKTQGLKPTLKRAVNYGTLGMDPTRIKDIEWEKGAGFAKNLNEATDVLYNRTDSGVKADEYEFTQKNTTAKLLGLDEFSAELSEQAEKQGNRARFAGDVAGAVGGMVPAVAVGAITKSPNAGMALMSASAAGAASEEAMAGGATLSEATKAGIVTGLKEYLVERAVGGIAGLGKGFLDPKLLKGQKPNGLISHILKSGGEGAEEVVADFLQQYINKGVWESEEEKRTFSDYLRTFGVGAAVGLILGVGSGRSADASTSADSQPRPLPSSRSDAILTSQGVIDDVSSNRENNKDVAGMRSPGTLDGRGTSSSGDSSRGEVLQGLDASVQRVHGINKEADLLLEREPETPAMDVGSRIPGGFRKPGNSEDNRVLLSQQVKKAGSQVVDETGEPILLEHWTPNMEFTTFGEGDVGFHFGSHQQAQGRAEKTKDENNDKAGRFIKAFLDIKNPAVFDTDQMGWNAPQAAMMFWKHGIISQEQFQAVMDLSLETQQIDYNSEAAKLLRQMAAEKGYDGIKYQNDYEGDGDSYAAFYPEQVVIVDDGLSPNGNDSQPKNTPPPQGSAQTSAFRSNTIENSGIFSDVEKQMEGLREEDLTYNRITERESMRQAAGRLEANYEGEKSSLEQKEAWSGVDLDAAMQILRDSRDSARETGDYSEVMKWVKIIQEKGTQAGQMIQAFAKYTKTPEGVMINAENVMQTCGADAKTQARVLSAVGEFSKTLDAIKKDDTDALIDLIRKQAKTRKTKFGKAEEYALRKQTPEYLYDFALTQMGNIANDYQAVSFGQKLSTYQAVSHLLNIKTALRNLVSNTTFDVVDAAAQNVGMIPDAILSIFTGKRTVGFDKGVFSRAKYEGTLKRGARSFAEVSLDVDVSNDTYKYEQGSRRTNKAANSGVMGRIMSAAEKAMGIELNVTDEAAKGGIVAEITESLRPYVEKGTITEAEAIEIAEADARYRTFQDDNMVSSVLAGLKDVLNIVGFGKKNGRPIKGKAVHAFGLGDLLQKYTQVPGSLICRSLEFSPVGYAKAIYSLCKAIDGGMAKVSPKQQRNIALAFSRATTGTGLIIAAAALVKAGVLSSTDGEEDKDRKALLAAQGVSGTQINLDALARLINGEDAEWQNGDNLVSVDFMEPLNSLFTTGYIVAQDDELKAKSLVGANIESIYRSIKDITTMQSIASINNAIQYHDEESGVPLLVSVPIEVGLTSLTGFIPSPLRQFSRALDPYYRETYNTTDRLFGEGEGMEEYAQTAADKVKSVTPGSKTLPEKLDPFGRAKEYGDSAAERWLNALVSPGNISTYEASGVEKEIERLYAKLEDASVYPDRNAPNTIGNKGKEWELTGTDKQEYLETSGQTAFDAIQDLIATTEYKNASDSKKAEMISDALKYGKYTARMEYYENQKIKVDDDSDGKRVYELVDAGFSNSDSLILFTDLRNREKDKDKRRYLYDSSYTDQEIMDIVEVYGLASDKCNEVWDEAESLNIPYRKYLEAYYILSSSETGYKKAEKIADAKVLGIDENKVLKLWDMIHK